MKKRSGRARTTGCGQWGTGVQVSKSILSISVLVVSFVVGLSTVRADRVIITGTQSFSSNTQVGWVLVKPVWADEEKSRIIQEPSGKPGPNDNWFWVETLVNLKVSRGEKRRRFSHYRIVAWLARPNTPSSKARAAKEVKAEFDARDITGGSISPRYAKSVFLVKVVLIGDEWHVRNFWHLGTKQTDKIISAETKGWAYTTGLRQAEGKLNEVIRRFHRLSKRANPVSAGYLAYLAYLCVQSKEAGVNVDPLVDAYSTILAREDVEPYVKLVATITILDPIQNRLFAEFKGRRTIAGRIMVPTLELFAEVLKNKKTHEEVNWGLLWTLEWWVQDIEPGRLSPDFQKALSIWQKGQPIPTRVDKLSPDLRKQLSVALNGLEKAATGKNKKQIDSLVSRIKRILQQDAKDQESKR